MFAVLICSKHLFMVAAPVYFLYLLRHYCCNGGFGRGIVRFFTMGAAVWVVFAAAFGPLLYIGQVISYSLDFCLFLVAFKLNNPHARRTSKSKLE